MARLSKITTKQGDTGQTLFCNEFKPKTHPGIRLLGSIDHLNSLIGVCNDVSLRSVQNDLFEISASIYKSEAVSFYEQTLRMEREIEAVSKELGPLKEFILPDNKYHVARSWCRKVEIDSWEYSEGQDADYPQYFNRLSDLLFCKARQHGKDSLWVRDLQGQDVLDDMEAYRKRVSADVNSSKQFIERVVND